MQSLKSITSDRNIATLNIANGTLSYLPFFNPMVNCEILNSPLSLNFVPLLNASIREWVAFMQERYEYISEWMLAVDANRKGSHESFVVFQAIDIKSQEAVEPLHTNIAYYYNRINGETSINLTLEKLTLLLSREKDGLIFIHVYGNTFYQRWALIDVHDRKTEEIKEKVIELIYELSISSYWNNQYDSDNDETIGVLANAQQFKCYLNNTRQLLMQKAKLFDWCLDPKDYSVLQGLIDNGIKNTGVKSTFKWKQMYLETLDVIDALIEIKTLDPIPAEVFSDAKLKARNLLERLKKLI